MKNVLSAGTHSFDISVPYKVIETDEGDNKPLIVYLHGFKQNIKQFEQLVDGMFSLNAYHLFIQAPYPVYDRKKQQKVKDWGRAWYLYDGEQDQFLKSLESASGLVEKVISKIKNKINVSSITVFGYSMGGYLAGYFGLSRIDIVDNLVVVGGRIKTEAFENRDNEYEQLNVLALHGVTDKSVKSTPQEKCCDQLSDWGANVEFKAIEKGHFLDSLYVKKIKEWLLSLGYE